MSFTVTRNACSSAMKILTVNLFSVLQVLQLLKERVFFSSSLVKRGRVPQIFQFVT